MFVCSMPFQPSKKFAILAKAYLGKGGLLGSYTLSKLKAWHIVVGQKMPMAVTVRTPTLASSGDATESDLSDLFLGCPRKPRKVYQISLLYTC